MGIKKLFSATLAVALLAVLFTLTGAQTATAQTGAATYQVTITNTMQTQWLTPINWAAHTDDVEIFDRGEYASPGIEAVAERGEVPVLAAEIADLVDNAGFGVSGVAPLATGGPIPPGASVNFEFTTDADLFTAVSMIICTNDAFGGRDGVPLPTQDGETLTYRLADFDAGTEINTENQADMVPAPFCLSGGAGTTADQPALAENERISRHVTWRGNGDQPQAFDWTRGEVADITITRGAAAPVRTYEATFTNGSRSQYMTPPNFAAHDRSFDLFERGQAASPGVEAVAENGLVPVLAAELQANVDDAGLGVSGVGASAPIAPGDSVTFTFTTEEEYFTVLSMLICTNDGFAAVDSTRLPVDVGESKTYRLRDWDAGTEINTENVADLVPAPFCLGGGAGTTADQPALAEDGVITRHRTIRGNGDLDSSLDWRRGRVGNVKVTLISES